MVDLDLSFQISLQRIDYLQRTGSPDLAFDAIEDLASELRADDADVYQRVHVMVLKALLCARTGQPLRGFTVAMRAARTAWQARLVPALWEAWGAVANVLGALREYDAERRVIDAILPQVCLSAGSLDGALTCERRLGRETLLCARSFIRGRLMRIWASRMPWRRTTTEWSPRPMGTSTRR
jgi:anaphase-promoting complex subunit 5